MIPPSVCQPWQLDPRQLNPALETRCYTTQRDTIRTDGRPGHAEPLDAFPDALERLGYAAFRLWWVQTSVEIRQTSAQTSPTSLVVLAAALVEGALTFVVKHARERNLSVFRSKDFERDPRQWKIDQLIDSAACGGAEAILDEPMRHRAAALVQSRQRIHAGRMLSDNPAGAPDLLPEQARDAITTAELVVRSVLDWLAKFPPGAD